MALALIGGTLSAQNLIVNPDLDADPAGWTIGCGTSLDWLDEDEASCPGSGAARVAGTVCQGVPSAGAGQCVAVADLPTVFAAARVRVASGLAPQSGVLIGFFDGADCGGSQIGEPLTAFAGAGVGEWRTVTFAVGVPTGALSAVVGFGAVDLAAPTVDVDSGYAGARPRVFHDDLEGNPGGGPPVCRWSLVTP
jgi:hypothetical protein